MTQFNVRRVTLGIMFALAGAGVSQLAVAQNSQDKPSSEGSGSQGSQDTKQNLTQKPEELESVTVTASRIARPDLSLPTPVMPITRTDLQLNSKINVAVALNDLPQFTPSTVAANSSGGISNAGRTNLNLRGLGAVRTLVLLNGQRFLGSDDLNTVPNILINSAQVVTGGASATWGSDAVAGVANVLLDNEYVGFDTRVSTGISNHGDGENQDVGIKWGTDYAAGKGNFVIGANFSDSHGIGVRSTGRQGITNGATLPIGGGLLKVFPNVGLTNETVGGVITTGVLAGNVFEPDGSLRPFRPGTFTAGTRSSGGDSAIRTDQNPIITPNRNYSVLAHNSFELSSNLKLVMQAQLAKAWQSGPTLDDADPGTIKIDIDNAFLSPDIRQAMRNAGQDSFMMGRVNFDMGSSALRRSRKNANFTAGLEGALGFWHWKGYYTHGQTNIHFNYSGIIRNKEYPLSVDSVISPMTQRPICRIALTDPSTNCVPINLFGEGAPSQAASDYVTGDALEWIRNKLDVFSLAVSGEPFQLPAGYVSVAFGADGRRESTDQRVGPNDVPGILRQFHFSPLKGAFTTKELFGEVFVPVLKDLPFARDLSVDIATRVSDYTMSGSVWSYKAGLNDEIVDGLRFRAAYSRDIRAANLLERFRQQSINQANVIDPVTGQAASVQLYTGGDPNLLPETSKTFTSGFSWVPPGLPGFTASVDYYNIKIKDVITSIGAQDTLNRCAAGTAFLCRTITRDASGDLVSVNATSLNLAQYATDGVDLDFSYKRPSSMFGNSGDLHARLLGTWVHKLSQFDGVNLVKYAGSVSGVGGPRWRSVGTVGFESTDFSISGRVRYLGATEFNRNLNIVNNRIGNYLYYDAGVKIGVAKDVRLTFDIRNLTNKKPNVVTGLVAEYYDVVGRYYTAGVEIKL